MWNFVREALGPGWKALDMVGFLQTHANQTRRRKHLFWLVFAAVTWTLWTTCNKIMIEQVFLRQAADFIFKFLAFLHRWHPLSRQRDHDGLATWWTRWLLLRAILLRCRSHALTSGAFFHLSFMLYFVAPVDYFIFDATHGLIVWTSWLLYLWNRAKAYSEATRNLAIWAMLRPQYLKI